MATGDQRVILWPYTIANGENALAILDGDTLTPAAYALAAGTYMARGAAGGASVGSDLCAAVATVLDAAYTVLYGSSLGFTVTITSAGHLSIANLNPDIMYLRFEHALFTLDPEILGWGADAEATAIGGEDTLVSPYQVAGRWHPSIPHVRDTGEHEAHVWAQGRGTQWTPWYVLHSELDNPATRRWLEWEHVSHARIFQSAADDADAATLAGVTTGDPSCAFESLLRYMLDESQPHPHQVYVSDVEPPGSATLSGRYYLVLDDSMVDAGGVPDGWEHEDTTQYQYRVSLELVREPA